MVVTIAVVMAAFFVSIKLSELAKKNHELAVQVSLLNHENYTMLERVEKLEEQLAQKENK